GSSIDERSGEWQNRDDGDTVDDQSDCSVPQDHAHRSSSLLAGPDADLAAMARGARCEIIGAG
ncbi:MAG TPA: hypothetical protein VHG30_09085, partial [Microvirga sp.]|nr:hypothetical protein [Microvirga sp.]